MSLFREGGRISAIVSWQDGDVLAMDLAAAQLERHAAQLRAYTIAYGSRCRHCKRSIYNGAFAFDGGQWLHRCLDKSDHRPVEWEPETGEPL